MIKRQKPPQTVQTTPTVTPARLREIACTPGFLLDPCDPAPPLAKLILEQLGGDPTKLSDLTMENTNTDNKPGWESRYDQLQSAWAALVDRLFALDYPHGPNPPADYKVMEVRADYSGGYDLVTVYHYHGILVVWSSLGNCSMASAPDALTCRTADLDALLSN